MRAHRGGDGVDEDEVLISDPPPQADGDEVLISDPPIVQTQASEAAEEPEPAVVCSRRGCLVVLLLVGWRSITTTRAATVPLVTARGTQLFRGDQPRRFMGANLWYAIHLGCRGCDRGRLNRELDRLRAAGVSSVRINALSEGPDTEPWRVVPSLQPAPGEFVEGLLEGLDYTLQQLELRGMDATVTLHNMWPWSGGFAQYVSWASGEPIPYPPPAEGGDWAVFQEYAARFYEDDAAMLLAEAAVERVVGRISSVGGAPLAESPAVLAWELCNEPRGDKRHVAYLKWLARAAAHVKRLDPNHLLAIGSEGSTPFADAGVDVLQDHGLADVDLVTLHVWAQNWAWYAPLPEGESDASLRGALSRATEYVAAHARLARQLGKPLVLEEFGLARDAERFTPRTSDVRRRAVYAALFEQVLVSQQRAPAAAAAADGDDAADAAAAAEISGVSFWAWAGEGRPREPGQFWQRGDDLVGDPPHERQGWYSVYDEDREMVELIAATAARLSGNVSAFYA